MPAEVEPPELARLLDVAERPRAGDWSLRSALVRYAQPEPARVGQVLEVVRRLDAGLASHAKLLAADGPALWAALTDGPGDVPAGPGGGAPAIVVGLLRAASALDDLGDRLAAWALDIDQPAPHAEVDATVASVTEQLDALGIAREERPPNARGPRGPRGRRGA